MSDSIPTELELAEAALRQARERGDLQAVSAANKRIQEIRERIGKARTRLTRLAGERIHLLEVVEQAQLHLKRCERNLEDHDNRIQQLREEITRLGGSTHSLPGKSTPPPSS
jgi:predicted  nucleic acid-binding Zn-ribbon protein